MSRPLSVPSPEVVVAGSVTDGTEVGVRTGGRGMDRAAGVERGRDTEAGRGTPVVEVGRRGVT